VGWHVASQQPANCIAGVLGWNMKMAVIFILRQISTYMVETQTEIILHTFFHVNRTELVQLALSKLKHTAMA